VTVRVKATLITTLTIGGLIAALYATSRAILLESFSRLESRTAASNLGRARDAILEELKGLDATCADWAYWDETYAFAGNGNRAYVEANLMESALANLQANVMLFLDASGRVVYGTGFDLGRERKTPLPSGLLEHFTPGSLLLQDRETGEASGIVSLPQGFLLLSARPVLKSDRKGPVAGTLAFGRYLDIEHTSAVTHLTLTTARALGQDEGLPHWGAVRPLGADEIVSSGVLDDIYGKPGLVLSVTMPRAIYQHGRTTVFYLLLSLIAVGLVSELVAYALLDRAVLVRLSRLSAGVRHVAETGNAAERLNMPGRDELADLADGINAMLESLERSEEAARAERDRLEMLTEAIGVGIAVISRDYRTVWANRVLKAVFGEVEGSCCHITYNQQAEVCDGCGVREVFETGRDQVVHEQVGRDKDGNTVWSQIIASPIRDREGNITAALEVVVPITDRKQAEEIIRHQARYDALTDLPNRAFFYERLDEALGEAVGGQPRLAVMVLDLDRFKTINDSLGHQSGDELLEQVAARLRGCLRQDDIVSRLGGDEFAVLLPRIGSSQDAVTVARKLLAAVRGPFRVAGSEVHITVSAGVSLYPSDARDKQTLVRNADAALYRAKDEGRDTFRFYAASMSVGSAAGVGAAVPG
jgi:diguanylate cyclase (GGDEF)-like protein/PAS domain S-box-containing protein